MDNRAFVSTPHGTIDLTIFDGKFDRVACPTSSWPGTYGRRLPTPIAACSGSGRPALDIQLLDSDAVLSNLSLGLMALGYVVESGKTKQAKIHRPVLFGENGTPSVNYEIDAFHDELGIAVEVEAGRGAAGNADYRDIVRTSLILDARYMALLLPVRYRTISAGREHAIHAYDRTRNQLDAIYASQRLKLPFEGVLLIGYLQTPDCSDCPATPRARANGFQELP